MAVTEIHTLATRVQERCAVGVEQETIIDFIRPIHRDFDVADDELVTQAVEHFEAQYVENGGVIVEWDGERDAMDPDE